MPTTAWVHLTARMSPAVPDLCRPEVAAWLWTHLRSAFPLAIAAVLMPDHPHVVVAVSDAEAARLRLARLLGHFGRTFGVGGRVCQVPEPAEIRGGRVLARQVRYVALNPCRAGLAACPLESMWSTHRDVIGACVDPWVTAARLADALGQQHRDFAVRHHAYVSGDPHASVAGTTMPIAARPTTMSRVALHTIAEAVAAATRTPIHAIRKRGRSRELFVVLACEQGWDQPARLAQICACCERTIANLTRGVDPAALQAARLCLGDRRLRRGVPEFPQDGSSPPPGASECPSFRLRETRDR